MTRNELKTSIVLSMREYHNGKWITPFVATKNIDVTDEPYQLLEDLISDNIIERSYKVVDGKDLPLVRYSTAKYKRPTLTLVPNTKKDNKDE